MCPLAVPGPNGACVCAPCATGTVPGSPLASTSTNGYPHQRRLYQVAVGPKNGGRSLLQRHAFETLVPRLIDAYPLVGRAFGRHILLRSLVCLARDRRDVVELAKQALADRSLLVRSEACAILAYSLSEHALPALEALRLHRDSKTRDEAAAAIDAIQRRNHHLFIDRGHTGTSFWVVRAGDVPPQA